MKTKIYKWLVYPCMAAALVTMTACEDVMDDKNDVEKAFQKIEAPHINVTSTNIIDFSSIHMNASISDIANVMESGILVSTADDMSNSETFKTSEVESDISMTATGLAERTHYYVCAYAYLKDGTTALSEIKAFDTPEAPKFSAAMLDNKTYAAKNILDSWGYTFNFNLTVTADEQDKNKVWITGLFPYAEYYLYNNYLSKVYGIVDTEKMTITIPKYQSLGVEFDKYGFQMFAFDADWNHNDLIMEIVNSGGALRTTSGLATWDGSNWYDYFSNPITFK